MIYCHVAGQPGTTAKAKMSNEASLREKLDIPVAFNRIIVDFNQSVPGSHHYLVEFWVPQAADDALRQKQDEGQPWTVDHIHVDAPPV